MTRSMIVLAAWTTLLVSLGGVAPVAAADPSPSASPTATPATSAAPTVSPSSTPESTSTPRPAPGDGGQVPGVLDWQAVSPPDADAHRMLRDPVAWSGGFALLDDRWHPERRRRRCPVCLAIG